MCYRVLIIPVLYQDLYQLGVDAYEDDNWLASVQYVEQSLPDYFNEYQRCLSSCDYQYDQHAFNQLHQQIINSNVAKRDQLLLGNICIFIIIIMKS